MKSLRVLGVCLALFVCAAPASAQSEFASAPDLKLPTLIWTGGVAADWLTTYQFSQGYGDLLHERNPLIRGLDAHPVWLVTAGASIDAATWWAAHRVLGERHPRLMKAALYGAAAYRVYLAAYNVDMMRQADRLRGAQPLR